MPSLSIPGLILGCALTSSHSGEVLLLDASVSLADVYAAAVGGATAAADLERDLAERSTIGEDARTVRPWGAL
jgi:hypothetical protein